VSQAHRDGARWLIGELLLFAVELLLFAVELLLFAVAETLWYFVWTPGMLIPVFFIFVRAARAVY